MLKQQRLEGFLVSLLVSGELGGGILSREYLNALSGEIPVAFII